MITNLQPGMKFVKMADLPVDKIFPNPKNPRPNYHLTENNPEIKELSLSLAESDQHQEVRVYELAPERPGEYMLVQGHRRHYAAKLAGLATLTCIVIQRPLTEAEELKWLCSEDSYKSEWGIFSKMQYAKRLADASDVAITSIDIITNTGLKKSDLERAKKIFKLEPLLIDHVKRWEEIQYSYSTPNFELSKDFPANTGIRPSGFAPEKAAITWDMFEAYRNNIVASKVKELSDLELQRLIAAETSRSNMKQCKSALLILESIARSPNPPAEVMAGILAILDDKPGRRQNLGHLTDDTNHRYLTRVANATKLYDRTEKTIRSLMANHSQIGSDIDMLTDHQLALLSLLDAARDLNPILKQKIEKLRKAHADD